MSGDRLTAKLAAQFRRVCPQCQLINLYGCSEVAGDVTWFAVRTAAPVISGTAAADREMLRASGEGQAFISTGAPDSVDGFNDVPVGVAIDGVTVDVVELVGSDVRKVPAGVIGQICVRGACVGSGYLNNRFVETLHYVPAYSHSFRFGLYRRLLVF